MGTDKLQMIRILAAAFNHPMTKADIEIWMTFFRDLSANELAFAVREAILKGGAFMPKLGEIYQLARPEENIEEKAALLADTIFVAQARYGTDKIGTERARAKIGQIGWDYIESMGGWTAFSNGVTDIESVPIMKAQARKSIIALLQREKRANQQALTQDGILFDLKSLGVEMKGLEP